MRFPHPGEKSTITTGLFLPSNHKQAQMNAKKTDTFYIYKQPKILEGKRFYRTFASISGSSRSLHMSSCCTVDDFSVLIRKVQFLSMEDDISPDQFNYCDQRSLCFFVSNWLYFPWILFSKACFILRKSNGFENSRSVAQKPK